MKVGDAYKTLKFDGSFKKKILRREKTCTIRFDDADNIEEGDRVMFRDEGDNLFAVSSVTRKIVRSAEEIVGMRMDGHREYRTMEEFLNEMNSYYGGRINEDSSLYILWFEVEG